MRQSGLPCPICNNPIRALDSTRNLLFHGRQELLHNRCWYENQDFIALLEDQHQDLNLADSVKRVRESAI
jgi:hypothetical protein